MKLVRCEALANYHLRLVFDDGLEDLVSLESLLEIGPFQQLRDERLFRLVNVDLDTGAVVWPAQGVHLDPETIYQQVAAERSLGIQPMRGASPPARDRAFYNFMAAALAPVKRGRSR